jgi:hypothetical protein
MIESKQISPSMTEKQKEALKVLFGYTNGINEVLYGGAA